MPAFAGLEAREEAVVDSAEEPGTEAKKWLVVKTVLDPILVGR